MEKGEIIDAIGANPDSIKLAWDIPTLREETIAPLKYPGTVRFVFVSRISPKKNLDGALRMLANCAGDITLEIYGPEDDAGYAAKCRLAVPPNIKVEWRGALPYERISEAFDTAHFLLFPTHGENFGHVIFEALACGRPVLLSDQTPWQEVEDYGVGWCTPLSDTERWTAILQKCVDMKTLDFGLAAECSHFFLNQWCKKQKFKEDCMAMLVG